MSMAWNALKRGGARHLIDLKSQSTKCTWGVPMGQMRVRGLIWELDWIHKLAPHTGASMRGWSTAGILCSMCLSPALCNACNMCCPRPAPHAGFGMGPARGPNPDEPWSQCTWPVQKDIACSVCCMLALCTAACAPDQLCTIHAVHGVTLRPNGWIIGLHKLYFCHPWVRN